MKMKNFLTYDECEFFTGPRLNLVIGPNGTGKSALTHAICLACCGSTSDVGRFTCVQVIDFVAMSQVSQCSCWYSSGRSTDLSKFVKHGAEGQESYAEVDILTEERSIVTIRRVINSENKGSKWFLNGKAAKQAEVKALVTKLSIDVDNLCSFMPQDKVGSFSRFTPKEILSNTLRSIQSPSQEFSLSDEQHALSEIQDAKEEYRRKRDAKQASLDAGRRDLDSMRGEMDRMARREEKQTLLREYEVRLLAVEIGALLQKETEMQALVDQKTAQLQEEKRKIAPLEVRERELKKEQTARSKAAEDAHDLQRTIEDALRNKKDAMQQRNLDVDAASEQLMQLGKARAIKEQQLRTAQQALDTKQAELAAALAVIPQADQRLAELRGEQVALNDRKEAIEEDIGMANQCFAQLRDEITALTKENSSLVDSKQLYRAKLLKSNDAHARAVLTAMDWLDNNQERLRQSGQLRSEVYGPVARYCSVADPACAVMIEKAIPYNRFYNFVVDNDADATFLKHQFRVNLKCKIDIVTMKRVDLDPPRCFPDRLIRELTLTGYLCDQLVCPDIIRSLFYTFHKLHKVLWGRGADNLTSEQQVRLCQADRASFTLYIHETTGAQSRAGSSSSGGRNSFGGAQQQSQAPSIIEYKGKFSRNPNAPPSTSSVGVTGNGMLQGGGGDEEVAGRREVIERSLAETNIKLKQAQRDLLGHKELLAQVQAEIQDNRTHQTGFRSVKTEAQSLKANVDSIRRKVDGLKRELSTNAQAERAELLADYELAVQKLLEAAQDTVKVVKKCNAHKVERTVSAKLRDELAEALRDVIAELVGARKGVHDLAKELSAAEKDRDEAKRRSEAKEKELKLRINLTGLAEPEYAEKVYKVIVVHCPESTVPDIVARMDQLEDEINRIADNPQLQRRFEDVTKDVERYENELARAAEEFNNAEESLHERSQRWLTLVRRTTEKLNVRFSAYMSDLQLDGEVKLREIGKFDDYEMQLRVKFRENSEMSELDGNKHSGGERAVSTVMFLMALQDMTTSPFRVVDEINQGMDESNERLVFDRIVKSCCGDASKPQYFLVTPKLLQGLGAMRNDDVTVLLVWNGPGTVRKWAFTDILRNLSHSRGFSQVSPAHSQSLTQSAFQQTARAGASSSSSAPNAKMRRGGIACAGAVVKEEGDDKAANGKRQRDPLDSDQEYDAGKGDEDDGDDSDAAPVQQQKKKPAAAKSVATKKLKD